MNSPSGLFTVHVEVGAVAVANHIAIGVGEGEVVSIDVDGPVIAVFVSQNVYGDNLVVAIHHTSEFSCGGFASRQGVGDGTIVIDVFVETGGEDDAVTSNKLAHIADANVVATRHRSLCDAAAAGHHDVVNIIASNSDVFFGVFSDFKVGFHTDVDGGLLNVAVARCQGDGALGFEVVTRCQ